MVFSLTTTLFHLPHVLNRMPKRPRSAPRARIKIKSAIPQKRLKTTKPPPLPNIKKMSSMTSSLNVEVLQSPIKSLNDKKEYRVIKLPNGLTACLISDLSNPDFVADLHSDSESESSEDESDMESAESSEHESISDEEIEGFPRRVEEKEEKLAAAGLCIGVGSFSDPLSIPGMAHFLEHMVFMGSEKYPQENDFDAFLKKRGGSDNASTECETTTFYFECLEKHLFRALDKFAQFFISPLMKRETMTREREAIESEFQMALPSDTYRIEQLLASFGKPDSPVNKFLWGNLVTLRDNVSDDVLYEGVHEFRKRHYSAHRMTLAIQARLPLDVLELYVKDCFAKVPNNSLPADDFMEHATGIFDTPMFNRLYYVKPVKDVCQVNLTWSMPSLLHMYKSKPHQYVSWLLGHEGKGSLLSYLRNKLWALGIYTGNGETGMEHNSMYALFTITMVLTPEGLEHIYEVIEAVFSYIELLKKVGPQERIYNEIKMIEDTSFRFQEEEDASDFVENLCEAMQYYPPEDYLTGDDLYFEYKPEAISMVLNKLNPKNVNIVILSSTVPKDINYDKTEPWFSTNYTDAEIPLSWVEKWSNIEPMPCFHMPLTNEFLTNNFETLNLSNINVPQYPDKILDNDSVELWYKPDNKFKMPIAFMHYYFISTIAQESALNACMIDLFISLLLVQITEEAYPAHVAELEYNVLPGNHGIIIKVNGYSEKLPALLELIVKYMKNLPLTTDKELFNELKDKQTKNYYNMFIKPSKLARDVRFSVLMDVYWSLVDKYAAISNVTYEMFKTFSETLLKKLHIQGLVQGNVTKETALAATHMVMDTIGASPLSKMQLPSVRVSQIPIGKNCCQVMSFNTNDCNSMITNYFQIGPGNLKSLVTIELMMLLMEEPLFDVLRTKEQLGYNVYCTVCNTFGILGYHITVNAQANKYTTSHVDKRIEAFIKYLIKTIKRMPDKKMNKVKQDLINQKQLVDVHLKDEVSRNWTEIVSQDFMFDRLQKEIAAIEEVKISEVRKWLDCYSTDEKRARKLSIHVVGHSNTESPPNECLTPSEQPVSVENKFRVNLLSNIDNTPNNYNYVTDAKHFKQDLFLFPAHKINK